MSTAPTSPQGVQPPSDPPFEGPTGDPPVEPESATSPAQAVAMVVKVLDLAGDPRGRPDHFVGTSYLLPSKRIFGGQALAQALVAAIRTVEDDRVVHSLHAYFLRPGNPMEPVEFMVERLRDGRSFSARRTHAIQGGQPILSMISSFQLPAEGLDHQLDMPDVPAPEDVPSSDMVPDERRPARGGIRPVELRHVDGPLHVAMGRQPTGHQAVWMRAAAPLPADPRAHAALLTFASDYTLLESVLRRHGMAWSHPGLRTASLDHAMWFHRPVRFDDWVLYVQESPSASGARGLSTGRVYSRDGVLVASMAQEGMMRLPLPPPS